jgi:hypothetical protein
LGVLFGTAILSFFGRITIRLASRRRLFLDDGFLTVAFVCLIGGTAICYTRINMIYLEFAVLRGDQIAALLAFQQIDNLFEQSKWQLAYLLLLWTTIFAVKWSYLAFFFPLLRAMPRKLIFYYRFSVAFSIISWLFLVVGEQLITCPYVGKAAGQSLPIDIYISLELLTDCVKLNVFLSCQLPKRLSSHCSGYVRSLMA